MRGSPQGRISSFIIQNVTDKQLQLAEKLLLSKVYTKQKTNKEKKNKIKLKNVSKIIMIVYNLSHSSMLHSFISLQKLLCKSLCFFLVGSRPGAPGEVFFVI